MSGRVKVIETVYKSRRPLQERTRTDYFVIHHIGEINREVTGAEIDQWHKNRGFDCIGYHYIVHKNGAIERGRPRNTVGSHCNAEDANFRSIGICVVGDFMRFNPIVVQVSALENLLADLFDIYHPGDPGPATIKGHKDLKPTDCPGTNLYAMIPDITKKVDYLIKTKNKVVAS